MHRHSGPAPFAAAVITGCLLLGGCGGSGGTAAHTPSPSAPGGVSVQASSADSAHVMWQPDPAAEKITAYEIFSADSMAKSVPATTTMVDISGLKPSTAYEFRVRARNSAGRLSPLSRAVRVTLPARVPDDHRAPSRPGHLRAVAEGAHAATLSWSRSRDNVRVTSYDIYQGQSKIHTVSGGLTTARITGLRPATVYTFTVRARDGADNSSAPSGGADLTTASAPGRPPATAPTGFHATPRVRKGVRSVRLSWTVPDTGGEVTEYQMYLGSRLTTTIAWGADAPRHTATYTFAAPEKPGTVYRVRIRAKLPDGDWGTFSAERVVTF
ncbi:fibronectin type III domain-containing protein [Streptomyces sp. NPDC059398]|uniref:fibronectin type III domain-containing protein n=1 Tax=Streptomyces sp. NPDC059398 TaxID=3346820 RepID=UPI0036860D57